jgi:hypothetical protein
MLCYIITTGIDVIWVGLEMVVVALCFVIVMNGANVGYYETVEVGGIILRFINAFTSEANH